VSHVTDYRRATCREVIKDREDSLWPGIKHSSTTGRKGKEEKSSLSTRSLCGEQSVLRSNCEIKQLNKGFRLLGP